MATHDPDTGDVAVFVVNRHQTDDVALSVPLNGFGAMRVVESWTLADPDLSATNTAEHPDRVVPHAPGDVDVHRRRPARDAARGVVDGDPAHPRVASDEFSARERSNGHDGDPHP